MLDIFYSRYGFDRKILTDDIFKLEVRYRDVQTNRFISREEARELISRSPERIETLVLYRAKMDMPEWNIKAGEFVSQDKVNDILELVKHHNAIIGGAERKNLTFEEAKELYEEYYGQYLRGEIPSMADYLERTFS